MSTTFPEPYGPRDQHNHADGTFVGRDLVYRFEQLDGKTKAVLHNLGKDAPALRKVIEKALREGVISAEGILALETAARNINEDVAEALWHAAQHINEDVATTIVLSSSKLDESIQDLDARLERLQSASGTLQSLRPSVDDWERIAADVDAAAQNLAYAAQARSVNRWSWRSFGWGLGFGLLVVILILGLWDFVPRK